MRHAVLPQVSVARTEQSWNEVQLLKAVRAPLWRLWQYNEPALILGRAQRRLDDGRSRSTGLETIVRTSGGGAVLAGPWMLGLSVALPADHVLASRGPVDTYRWLGEGIAASLRRCSLVAAHAVAPQSLPRAPRSQDWACFGSLSPWEVAVCGRKIAGLAQVRRRQGILLVAGVLLRASPWELLCQALGHLATEAMRLEACTTDCEAQSAGAVGAHELRRALTQCLDAKLYAPRQVGQAGCALPADI